MKQSIVEDLDAQLKEQMITQELRDKAVLVIDQDLTADDWKDIDNMSTVEASDMVLDLARIKQGVL
jgi:hypothetical protein